MKATDILNAAALLHTLADLDRQEALVREPGLGASYPKELTPYMAQALKSAEHSILSQIDDRRQTILAALINLDVYIDTPPEPPPSTTTAIPESKHG